jgi:hypothetical protein
VRERDHLRDKLDTSGVTKEACLNTSVRFARDLERARKDLIEWKEIAKATDEAAKHEAEQVDKLRAELEPLREFYKAAAKVECEGKCGKFQPVLQDSDYGSRTRNGEWLCPPCHSKVCGVDVTLEENKWHSCQALRD